MSLPMKNKVAQPSSYNRKSGSLKTRKMTLIEQRNDSEVFYHNLLKFIKMP